MAFLASSNGTESIDDCERNRVLLVAVYKLEALRREKEREAEDIRCNFQLQADSDEMLKKSFKKQLKEAKQALIDEKEMHKETTIALEESRRSHLETKALLKDEQRKYEYAKMQYDKVKVDLDSEINNHSITKKALTKRLKLRKKEVASLEEEAEQMRDTLQREKIVVEELARKVHTLESDLMKSKILLEAIDKDHRMLYLKRDTQGDTNSNSPDSKALVGLESFLDDLCKKYLVLSPQSGSVALCLSYLIEPGLVHPSLKEFIRGGVISTMCAWEAYIKNALEEAFDIMIAECPGSERWRTFPGNLSKMKTKWPYCQQAAHQRIKPACKSWKDYRKHILKDMRPLLFERKGIDILFKELFYPGQDKAQGNLSSCIAGHRLTYPYWTRNGEKVMLQINKPQLLHDILRLYYGVRCTFAHGCNERTVNRDPGSCLYKFPQSPDELPLAPVSKEHADHAKEVAQELFRIFEGIRDCRRNVDVEYRTLVNLNAFILCTSRSMTLAIKEVLDRDFGIVVWN